MAKSIAILGVRVEGLEGVQAALDALPAAVLKQIDRRVVGAGATVIKKAVTKLVPVGGSRIVKGERVQGGRLKASIKIKRKTYRRTGNVVAIVGYSEKKGDAKGAPHAHLVEFGTVKRFHKSGKSTGVMPVFGFMRRALRASASAAQRKMEERMKVAIHEAVTGVRSKHARKGGS